MMRQRTPWDWKLKVYPFIVIPWIFYVAAGDPHIKLRLQSVQANGSEASGGHSVAAPFNVTAQETSRSSYVSPELSRETLEPAAVTPQIAAFPDRTCFYGRYPLESFCFVLTQERG